MSPRKSGLERESRDSRNHRREAIDTANQWARERKKLERLAEGSEKSSSQVGRNASTVSADIASKFRMHLDEKRRPADLERTKNEAKTEKEADRSENQNAKGNRISDTRVMSLNDALKEAKQIQQDKAEIARTSRFPKEWARGKDVRQYHEIDYYQPQVRGVSVTSYEHLQEIVERDFPGCKRIEGFDKMLEGARKHFELGDRLEGKKYLGYGDVARFARELDVGATTVVDQAVRGKPSRIYLTLDSAISKSEGLVLVERMIQENNGIKDMGDIDRRLGCYYAEREYRSSRNYKKDLEMAGKYFKFIGLLKEGGSLTEIARQLDVGWGETGRWHRGIAPWMIQLASSIPDEAPKEGYVWLPTVTGPKNNPSEFIQVPLRIDDWRSVRYVVEQLKSIEGPEIDKLSNRFGDTSKEDSMMYVLGTFVSDGSSQFTTETNTGSSKFTLGLGRKYLWSIDYGDGTCFHLSKLGIWASQKSDQDYRSDSTSYPNQGSHNWSAEASVLITWVRRSGIRLEDSSTKTYDSIDAKWILSAPESWRVSFLQGVCDGDGCASIKAGYLSIATSTNTEFFMDLLKSLGISSHEGDGAVIINAQDSIKRAHEIGLFRYASDRKENLAKFARMIDTYDHTREMTDAECDTVRRMRSENMSWGAISEALYDEFGHTLPYYSIKWRALKLGIE